MEIKKIAFWSHLGCTVAGTLKGRWKKYPRVSSLIEKKNTSTNVLASVHYYNYPNFLTNPFLCPYRTNYKLLPPSPSPTQITTATYKKDT